MTILQHTLTSLASAALITAIAPIKISCRTPSLPFGLTFQKLLGIGLMLPGPYNSIAACIKSELADEMDELRRPGAQLKLWRWAVAGVGMFLSGWWLLKSESNLVAERGRSWWD